MTNNKDALNEMKRLAGLQLNEYTIAEAPKKSAAPAADDGRQYYRDPGDGGPIVPLGTKSQAGPGLFGDEKGRYDKMPGDNTRFFSTPGPEAAKPAPAAPAPAPKANVTKDQLDKFRQDTGNPNATLGQYLNNQQGKTARKGGANDPDVIQQKLGPGQDAYRPVPGAPAPQGKAAPAPATPAPLAPGGQFAPGSTIGLNPPAPNTPPGQMSRTPGGPEINTPIPGFGPNATPVPPLKGPAGPDARSGSYPDRLPGTVNNTPAAPKPTIPQTGSDDYALGGGKDVYRPLLNPDRTIDAIKPSVPNFMKPLPSAPFDKNSTGGAPNMGGTPSAPVKPNTVVPQAGSDEFSLGGGKDAPPPPAARADTDPYSLGGGKDQYIKPATIAPNPTQSTLGGSGNEGNPRPTPTLRNPVPVQKSELTPLDKLQGASSDVGMTGKIADDPSYPGYDYREIKRDIERPFQKLKSYFDSDQHMGKDVVTDSEEPMDEAEPTFFDRVDNQNPFDAAIDRLKRLGGITGYQKDQPSAAPKKTDGLSDRDREQMNNLVGSVAADKPNSFKPGPPSDKPNNFEKRSDESIETMAWLAGLR